MHIVLKLMRDIYINRVLDVCMCKYQDGGFFEKVVNRIKEVGFVKRADHIHHQWKTS